jgi:DNA modification methylase
MDGLQIVSRPPGELKPSPSNARTHSTKQIGQIADSIRSFGFNNPVLIDREDYIIAGHGRVVAAQNLGMTHVPTVRLEHLSDAQKRAYILADNRLAELAGWDRDILAIELQNLLEIEGDIDFEITDIGFETAEIDLILCEHSGEDGSPDPADVVPKLDAGPAVTKPGDLWILGPHRLYCANALQADSYSVLMDGQAAQVVFTDPPYNVPIQGHVSGLGKARHAEFAMASGEMSEAEFTRFLTTVFRHLAAASVDGSIHFVCIDWRHLLELLRAGRIAYSELKNLCVWAKANGGMGSLYRSQHELVAVFKNGDAPHINNVELGRHGRNRTNVWNYVGMNSFQPNLDENLSMHPTVKPVAMLADAIMDCSTRNGIVLDPFVGSGTTILAAQRTGRRCYALELDPRYVDVALRRVRGLTGIEPICARTGREFSSLEATTGEAAVEAASKISAEIPVA